MCSKGYMREEGRGRGGEGRAELILQVVRHVHDDVVPNDVKWYECEGFCVDAAY